MPRASERSGVLLRLGSSTLLSLIVFAAPLLAGTVHRASVTGVLAATLVAVAVGLAGERLRGRGLQGASYSQFFMLFVAVAGIQALPLPIALRGLIDPAGNRLLACGPHGVPQWWPATLDPVATRQEIGTAAAALGVFLLAFHAGATGRRHLVLIKTVAVSGTVGVVIAVLHHIFDAKELYGRFVATAPVLVGPFVNTNHSAQLFELAGFSALALAFYVRGEERVAWGGVALLNAAGAMATLSRGSLVALITGTLTFVVLRRSEESGEAASPQRLRTTAWILLSAGLVVALSFALGAGPLVEKVSRTAVAGEHDKPALWKDSLSVVRHHPAGIGRHAFEHVYPAYKTLSWKATFSFVENAPLQLIIDVGWLGFFATLLFLGLLIRRFRRHRRADNMEAALLAGLAAVAAHNFVDFGLETLGLRLPFAAIAGMVIGRSQPRDQPTRTPTQRRLFQVPAAVFVAGLVGLFAQWQSTADDFDAAWKKTTDREQRKQLMVTAATSLPTDYFFPFLQSFDEPLKRPGGGPSPRLAALNRALSLCPSCPQVHRQAARVLFQAGLRSQSVASWRDVLRLDPPSLSDVLTEMDRQGYTSAEISDLAAAPWIDSLQVARYMIGKRATSEVSTLLAVAQANGLPELEMKLVSAELAMVMGNMKEASRVADEARRLAPADARPVSILATVEEALGDHEKALSEARAATNLAPNEPRYARHWLDLVQAHHKWGDLDAALANLNAVYQHNGIGTAEVHVAAGNAHWSRGHLPRALAEFRTAVILDPTNTGAWRGLALGAEEEGDLAGSLAALDRLAVLTPNDDSIKAARQRIARLRDDYQRQQILKPGEP